MPQFRTTTRRSLPIVLDQGPHSERALWIGALALDFCLAKRHENADSLVLSLELTDRVRRRAAELRAARRARRVFASA